MLKSLCAIHNKVKNGPIFISSAYILGFLITLLILFFHLPNIPRPPDLESSVYLVAAIIGNQGLLWGLAFLLMFPLFFIIRNKKFYFFSTSFLISIVSLLYFVNIQIYKMFKFYLEGHLFQYLNIQGLTFLNSYLQTIISELLFGVIGFLLICIVVYALLIYFNFLANIYKKIYIGGGVVLTVFIVSMLIYAQVIHAIADIKRNNKITFLSRHIPYYHPLTAKRFSQRYLKIKLNDNNYQKDNFVDLSINYPHQISCSIEKSVRKNIIWLMVDSLRHDMFNPKNMPQTYSYTKKIKETQVFLNHLSGGNTTSTGLFSLFYSLPGTYYANFVKSQVSPLFFKAMEELGYDTQVSVSADMTMSKIVRTIFRDIEESHFKARDSRAWRSDELVTDEFISFLDKAKRKGRPFFGFLLYNSTHDYSLPEGRDFLYDNYLKKVDYLTATQPSNAPLFFNTYKNTIYFIDELLGKTLRRIEELNLLKDSIIIISSDHGQEFDDNEKGYWGHNSNFSNIQLKVPMVIFDSELEAKTYSNLTTHFDILPYIFKKYLNCNDIHAAMAGVDIFVEPKERTTPLIFASYSQTAFRNRDYTYVLYPSSPYEVFNHRDKYRQVFGPIPQEIYRQVLKKTTKYYR